MQKKHAGRRPMSPIIYNDKYREVLDARKRGMTYAMIAAYMKAFHGWKMTRQRAHQICKRGGAK